MNRKSKWIISIALLMNLAVFGVDIIDYNYDDTWYLNSDDLTITETGSIDGGYDYGIEAQESTYSITNYGLILSWETAINAQDMIGNIYNYGSIISTDYDTIDADGMIGDIYNYGSIISNEYGYEAIDASSMKGNIYNHGSIISISDYDEAINASSMIGNIYNYGLITGTNEAINADGMTGNIYNYGIIFGNTYGVLTEEMTGTIYNYGTISGNDYSIYAYGDLNIVGNGTFKGDIYNDGDVGYAILNLSNDIAGTVLDLSDARLAQWNEINLLQGEMIITQVGPRNTLIYQTGEDTYIHMGRRYQRYHLEAGVLNPYSESSPYRILGFNELIVREGATLELNFGSNNEDSDRIRIIEEGYIEEGVTLRFLPGEKLEPGTHTYRMFSHDYFDGEVFYELPIFYTSEVGETREYYIITRLDKSYESTANKYNKDLADLIDNYSGEDAEEVALQLSLEQALSVNAFNKLLDSYNKLGYSSLANTNINVINSRINNLFSRLGGNVPGDSGIAQSTVLWPVFSNVCATGATPIKNDANGNSIWFDVYAIDNSLDGLSGYELESDGYEVAIGIDHVCSNTGILTGIAFNYSEFNSDLQGNSPMTIESTGFGLSIYGQINQDQLSHKAIIGFTAYNNEAENVDFDSSEMFAAYRAEYLISNDIVNISPIAGLRYAIIDTDTIAEDDSGLNADTYDSLETELGVKLSKQFNKLNGSVSAIWVHELLDTENTAKAYNSYGEFNQIGIERDEDLLRLSVGANYRFTESVSIDIEYAKELGSNSDNNSLNAKLTVNF